MKKLFRLVILLILCAGFAAGQTGVVKRSVNLRPDPSSENEPIEKLSSGARVQLLEQAPTSGYYHVRTADGEEGWIWGRNITIQASAHTSTPPDVSTDETAKTTAADSDLLNVLFTARVPAVGKPLIENEHEVCGAAGDAKDQKRQDLNRNKNRTDQPTNDRYVEIAWDQLKNLPKSRVRDLQGAPVSVVGFLSHQVKVESSGSGESTNCHLTNDDEVDWHIYLTRSAAQPISQAIIIETTPRVRPMHKWTKDMLDPLVDSHTPLRISGWLLYDFEHENVIGKQRASVWEVHPVTRIQVQRNGQWVDLDD